MEKRFINLFLTLLLSCACFFSSAQDANPYIINGSAYQENCNCYTLTEERNFQSGSVWNKYKINLTQSFDYKFNVYLGCKDQDGADGIVFVLQPISTSIGTTGQGLGFGGVSPSIGVVIDTWQNTDFGDPSFDHIGIYKNGDVNNNHAGACIAGPVGALQDDGNIEDCEWHTFRIIWDAPSQNLSAQFDGVDRVKVNIDLVNIIFNGDPNVFWGFTGATGGENNRQRFCTSLNPGFKLPADQKTCYPIPILFQDSSSSFGSIVKWFWDFGDAKTDSVETPSPHVYPAAGIYEAKLNIVGNNGCLSDTFRRLIIIGSKPVADFVYTSPIACSNDEIGFRDSSYVQYGTINSWAWNVNNGQIISSAAGVKQKFPPGMQKIGLTVGTLEGCQSDTTYHEIEVLAAPTIQMKLEDACFGDPVTLNAFNENPSIDITHWSWQLGDGSTDSITTIVHTYTKEGQYQVQLMAMGNNGCHSDTDTGTVNIYKTNAFAGNDTLIATGQPLQLHGSGGNLYKWAPATGLDNSDIADPIATLQQDATYILTAYTNVGCPSTDTIHIKVYKGPAIYVPSGFTPNNDGHNDRFRCLAVGMTTIYFFNVYNRFGQLMYSSQDVRQGWDGTFNGKPQPIGTYVWMVKGLDYQGKEHLEKGTVVLIR